jgi:hypothetical protein
MVFSTDGTTRFTIAGTGAATFSSSVKVNGLIEINGAGSNSLGAGPYIQYGSVAGNRYALQQFNGSNGFDFWYYDGSSWSVKQTFSSNGNVLIGTTTDGSAKLRVNGDILIPADGRLYGNSATVTGSRSFIELYNSSTGNINLVTGFSTASIVFGTQGGTERMRIASGGSLTINNLSGSGNRIVVANSGGTLISAVIGSGLAFDGTTLTATGGSSGSISGSGTSGTIALFTGTSSIGNSVITQSGTQIGINNTSPLNTAWGNDTNTKQLSINGSSYAVINLEGSTGRKYSMGVGDGNFYMCYDNTAARHNLIVSSTGASTFVSSVTATSFFESSDATIKTLVEDDYQAKGIDSVVAKLYIKNGKQELGYYAQDLEGVLPSAVSKGSNGLLNLSYREVHTAKIAYLEQQIKELRNELLKPS